MAQVKKSAEEENVRFLQGLATDAATAFRDYLVGSDETKRNAFLAICARLSKGKPLTESRPFMEKLLSEIDAIRSESAIKPLADAFQKDRGRLAGVLWSNPAVYSDFINTVHEIRAGVLQGAAKDERVLTLAAATKAAKDKDVPKGSDIARVRAYMAADSSLSAEDAARKALEATTLDRLSVRCGDNLVSQVSSRMPYEQARLCVDAFRSFMPTWRPDKERGVPDDIQFQPRPPVLRRVLQAVQREDRRRERQDRGGPGALIRDPRLCGIPSRFQSARIRRDGEAGVQRSDQRRRSFGGEAPCEQRVVRGSPARHSRQRHREAGGRPHAGGDGDRIADRER